jgi:hypothetical protein
LDETDGEYFSARLLLGVSIETARPPLQFEKKLFWNSDLSIPETLMMSCFPTYNEKSIKVNDFQTRNSWKN